jgi:hypothetical protein
MISIAERLSVASEPVEGALWQWACRLRSAIPGIVVSFDPDKQTCVVQPAIQELVLLPPPATPQNSNPDSTQNIPTSVSIEPLQDVPIIMMRVPGWSITLPITEGAECLLIFADSCIDGWWQNGGVNAQFDRRRHDLSDAMALFGPWSQPSALENYSTDSLQIRSDDQSVVVDLRSGKVTIAAPTVEIKEAGGTSQPLVTADWLTFFNTDILPFLQSKGYTGPTGPTPSSSSLTTVLEAQ